MSGQAEVEPIYETYPGWSESTQGITDINKLPQNAIAYIRQLEKLVGVPITMLSTSPERNATILLKDPFAG